MPLACLHSAACTAHSPLSRARVSRPSLNRFWPRGLRGGLNELQRLRGCRHTADANSGKFSSQWCSRSDCACTMHRCGCVVRGEHVCSTSVFLVLELLQTCGGATTAGLLVACSKTDFTKWTFAEVSRSRAALVSDVGPGGESRMHRVVRWGCV